MLCRVEPCIPFPTLVFRTARPSSAIGFQCQEASQASAWAKGIAQGHVPDS